MKEICVIGGGTAGWITALSAKKFYPNYNVTLIESEEIGILGAGEGSVPFLINVLNLLDIPVDEIIKECKATYKYGINFVNWNGDGQSFFHLFEHKDGIDSTTGITATDIIPLNQHGNYSLHFDARLFAVYLQKVAASRGINRVEGKVSKLNGNNTITGIVLDDESVIPCDFVFDCSGFARLVIGKHHGVTWNSYKDHLPLNSALPFFIPHNNNVPLYTDAIAMKYGWTWRIPVKDRYGCGYVYNSNYISDQEAKDEAEEYFKQTLVFPKVFRFEAGTFEKTLVNNSMAVGLSQGFLEPLEATSIWISSLNLIDFFSSDGLNKIGSDFENNFNDRCLARNNSVLDFVYLHYMTRREDSLFWKEFKVKHPMPSRLKDVLDLLNSSDNLNINFKVFTNKSWLQVAHGLQLLDKNKHIEIFKDFHVPSIVQTGGNHLDILDHFKE
jgi:tryptophan halogenase